MTGLKSELARRSGCVFIQGSRDISNLHAESSTGTTLGRLTLSTRVPRSDSSWQTGEGYLRDGARGTLIEDQRSREGDPGVG